jgi:integrase/recombinase XerD
MTRWNNMREQVEDYLDARRRLGYQLKIPAVELLSFARFVDMHENRKILTMDLAVEWASMSPSQINRARRLEMIRGLAKYCILFEPETQIPPRGLLGPAHRRLTPYIYTPREISGLMQAAAKLNNGKGLRPATIHNLIGLLSATGLRISSAFFMLDNGYPINYRQTLYSFQTIRAQMPWRRKRPPRIYDPRHTFACNRLLSWYEEGIDVNNAILMLSVYLGRVKLSDTYWYLTGIPSLMSVAANRFENYAGGETWPNR